MQVGSGKTPAAGASAAEHALSCAAYSDKCSVGSDGSADRRSSSCTSASWPAVKILPSAERSIASQLARNTSSASKSGFISFTTSSCIWLKVAEIRQRGPIRPFGGKHLTRICHTARVFPAHCPDLVRTAVRNGLFEDCVIHRDWRGTRMLAGAVARIEVEASL